MNPKFTLIVTSFTPAISSKALVHIVHTFSLHLTYIVIFVRKLVHPFLGSDFCSLNTGTSSFS